MARVEYRNWAVTDAGDTIGLAAVEVRRRSDNGLTTLYTAETGGGTKTNPFTADADGSYTFWVDPDRYQILTGTGPSQETIPFEAVRADENLTFAARADLVTWVAGGGTASEGAIIKVGDIAFRWETGATAIADLPGLLPVPPIKNAHYDLSASDGFFKFDIFDYLPDSQQRLVRQFDYDQDESLVTAAVQAMMDDVFAWVEATTANDSRKALAKFSGLLCLNDEAISEAAAQKLWDMSASSLYSNSRFKFDWEGAEFRPKNWPSHKAVRTSGYWAFHSITDPVPMALWRWETRAKVGFGPDIQNGVLRGAELPTDPIGIKMSRINFGHMSNVQVLQFMNSGRWMENINNSDFHSTQIHACGWQPTQDGATGTTTADLRGTLTGTAIQTNENVFVADHVGKWIMANGAGANGSLTFAAKITSVTDAQNAVMDTAVVGGPFADVRISFVATTGSITANTNSLVLDTAVTSDLQGRYVMVLKAGSKLYTDQDLLVTRVTTHAGDNKTMTLATQARETVSSVPVVLAPSDFIGRSDDQLADDGVSSFPGFNNDCQFYGDRIENTFSNERGGAVCGVYQGILNVQFFGTKLHGKGSADNSFGGNMAIGVFDNCINMTHNAGLLEWGDWQPDYGKVITMGSRTHLVFSNTSIGGFQTSERVSLFYIDPQNTGAANCRVLWDGAFNTPPGTWNQPNQAVRSFGANGGDQMFISPGVVVSRDQEGYPQMAPTQANQLEVLDTSPQIIFRDLDDNQNSRFLQTGGEIAIDLDSNNDGVFDNGGFGYSVADKFIIDFADGAGKVKVFDRGTFTPTLAFGGTEISTLGGAYSVQSGEFMQVLDRVYIYVALTLSAKGTATGNATIVLPSSLRPGNNNEAISTGYAGSFAGLVGGGDIFGSTQTSGTGSLLLRQMGAGGGGQVQLNEGNFTNSTRLEMSGWYKLI